jgi:hypothetical protein
VLIEVTSKAQADEALKMTNWIDVQVNVSLEALRPEG